MTYICQCMDCGYDFELNNEEINKPYITCPICRCADVYIEDEE